MSSILDALKKLERERRREEAARHRGPMLDPDEPRARRRPPLLALAAAGALGAVLGLAFALWSGSRRQSELEPPTRAAKPTEAKVSETQALPSGKTQAASSRADQEGEAEAAPGSAEEIGLGPSAKRRLKLAYERRRKRLQEKAQAAETHTSARAPLDSLEPDGAAQNRLAARHKTDNALRSAPEDRGAASGPSGAEIEGEPTLGGSPAEPATPPQTEEPAAEEPAAEEVEKVVDTGRSPPGVPKVVLGLLQWSPEPSRRFAFISVDGSPYQKLREGEAARGLAITSIDKDSVTFRYESTRFVIRARH